MEILALTLDIIGKVMVAYTALAVHHRVRNEHKIDGAVFKIMKREMIVGVLGIATMIAGYVFHIIK
ncbi:MAG: hypothetical protein Q8O87_01735 [bacterium]|nr:hypothetical protein [bacterium]